MKKKLLITGGLGFIGSHYIKKHKNNYSRILCIDNLSNNTIDLNDPALSDINVIISDLKSIKIENINDIDLILHLASPIGTVSLLDNPGYISKEIIDDLYWVINVAKINQCPIIFASTCEVYGEIEQNNISLHEGYQKIFSSNYSIRNEYSVGKFLCEIILNNISKSESNFKYQIFRPFNVVGYGQSKKSGHVIPRFFNQAINSKDITVYADGSQKRSFLWVEDMVDAIYTISKLGYDQWNQVWNVGNKDNTITINDLANLIKSITNSNSNIINIDPKDIHGKLFEDAPTKIPNSEKIMRLTSWKPTKTIYEILEDIYKNEK